MQSELAPLLKLTQVLLAVCSSAELLRCCKLRTPGVAMLDNVVPLALELPALSNDWLTNLMSLCTWVHSWGNCCRGMHSAKTRWSAWKAAWSVRRLNVSSFSFLPNFRPYIAPGHLLRCRKTHENGRETGTPARQDLSSASNPSLPVTEYTVPHIARTPPGGPLQLKPEKLFAHKCRD